MSQPQLHTVIIPCHLAEYAVYQRATCGKYAAKTGKGYHVATELQYIAFFCILKSYSKDSGRIQSWTQDIDGLMAITNLSRRAIYSYIKKLHELELIRLNPTFDKREKWADFSLISWDKLAEKYGYSELKYQAFIPVTYECFNEKQTPKYVLIQAEIIANQRKQAYMIAKKNRNHNQNYAPQKKEKKNEDNSPERCMAEAKQVLLKWTSVFKSINLDKRESEDEVKAMLSQFVSTINPSINRGLAGYMRAFNFKDLYRSIYLKKQLEKRGFGSFQRIKIYSHAFNRAPKYYITDYTGDIPVQIKLAMKDIYDRQQKLSGVWLTDHYKPIKNQAAA
jgi:hypothetical protein